MFTIKAYTDQGRCSIKSADSFTILRTEDTGAAEVTLHRKGGDSERFDILPPGSPGTPRAEGWPAVFQWAFIENEAGKTVETIRLHGPFPRAA